MCDLEPSAETEDPWSVGRYEAPEPTLMKGLDPKRPAPRGVKGARAYPNERA